MESITKVIVEKMESALAKMEEILARSCEIGPGDSLDRNLLGLVMHLRDILKIHEVDKLTLEQAQMLIGLFDISKSYYDEVKSFDKNEYRQYSKDLLSVGLTWLPITEKAQRDIEEMKKELLNGIENNFPALNKILH